MHQKPSVTFTLPATDPDLLEDEAVEFLVGLHHRFDAPRRDLLAAREGRQERLDGGELPDFLPDTTSIRSGDWVVDPVLFADLQDRRVEITGPVERKMMVNALNSGARAFMADFEDSSTPTWSNLLAGQRNLIDAHAGSIRLEQDGKVYALGPDPATLIVRPRGWHLPEKHVLIDGEAMSGSLFDFGLYAFHNLRGRHAAGSGLYLYLPKLESHLEARLWNDVFDHTEDVLAVPRGTIRATVLIETILAAFEMDEILFELRTHSAGLNAGRWDYIFSVIKKFRNDPTRVLPDRSQIGMTAGFMRAYTELLVQTCHRRGTFAMGGMSAFIPNRRDPVVTERALAQVRADKAREAGDGCDGTWVAHPDLVSVAMDAFDAVLGDQPNQIGRRRPDVSVAAAALLDTTISGGTITEGGLRMNVDVGIRYLASWLAGNGAAAIHDLMEDAATAEISRSQVWQWVRTGAATADGTPITPERVRSIADDVIAELRAEWGDDFGGLPVGAARGVFERVALAEDFEDFLTLPAYELID